MSNLAAWIAKTGLVTAFEVTNEPNNVYASYEGSMWQTKLVTLLACRYRISPRSSSSDEKGPSASLLVRHVPQRTRSSLAPSIQTLLKLTVCLPLMRRCTSPHRRVRHQAKRALKSVVRRLPVMERAMIQTITAAARTIGFVRWSAPVLGLPGFVAWIGVRTGDESRAGGPGRQ